MKKLISLLLSTVILTGSITAAHISGPTAVYAAEPALTSAVGDMELIYATWSDDSNAAAAAVYYKKSTDTSYTVVDAPLVRQNGTGGRVDVPGLAAGSYDIRIVTSDGTTLARKDIPVEADDRSGYAHFNYTSGIGGYNDDGTPKSNAKILYVTNENKNTVTLNDRTGIGNILKNASEISTPLIVRIIGKVDTQTRDSDGTKTTDINNGVVALNGLTDKEMTADSYFNMLDVAQGKNITVEGIGDDAVIEKWGFTWSKCESIEVKNLNFTKYPEDACSTANSSKRIWFHENTFDVGENKYDLTEEQDKHEGDGSTDINGATYVTLSYNRYNNCHKTSLHGGSDSAATQYNITWHHNYMNQSSSRMPLVRHANVHSYNNYFYKGSKCIDARASAWVLSEANYFDNCSKALLTTASSSQGNPVIKSWNDVFSSSGTSDGAGTIHIAAARDEVYTESANKESYHNFDTNTSKFYYDSTNKASDVTNLTDAEQAKADCIALSGVLVSENVLEGSEDTGSGEISTETTTQEPETETTTSSLIPLDETKYDNNTILTDTSHFKVVDCQNESIVKINESGYVQFSLSGRANVTISYKCGSGNSSKSAACVLNGQQSPMLAGGSSSTSDFTVTDLAAGTYKITAVVNGTTTVQIAAITVDYIGGETTTESTTETTTQETESTTEPTTGVDYMYGDADCSGTLTANDAAAVLKKALDSSFITILESKGAPITALDMNGDGNITADDAAYILALVLNP